MIISNLISIRGKSVSADSAETCGFPRFIVVNVDSN